MNAIKVRHVTHPWDGALSLCKFPRVARDALRQKNTYDQKLIIIIFIFFIFQKLISFDLNQSVSALIVIFFKINFKWN